MNEAKKIVDGLGKIKESYDNIKGAIASTSRLTPEEKEQKVAECLD